MFYFNFGGFQVIGASPEILVRVKGGTVTIRPIAGTRPRGATPAEDLALEAELLADPKERAEHLMLLDLGRNDVGRVAKIGTVDPNEQFIIERYSHVMHIVSNVDGTLADGQDALSALLAGLPAGTVSGAPKVRAMQIIDELETEKRGVYGGGVGYFGAERRHGHLHRAPHRGGEGRHALHPGRRRRRLRQRPATPSTRRASTRPRPCARPPATPRCSSAAGRGTDRYPSSAGTQRRRPRPGLAALSSAGAPRLGSPSTTGPGAGVSSGSGAAAASGAARSARRLQRPFVERRRLQRRVDPGERQRGQHDDGEPGEEPRPEPASTRPSRHFAQRHLPLPGELPLDPVRPPGPCIARGRAGTSPKPRGPRCCC